MGSLDKFTHNNAYRAKCKARHVAALRSAALRQRQVDIHPTAETPVESLEGSREDQGGQAKGGGTAKGGGSAEGGGGSRGGGGEESAGTGAEGPMEVGDEGEPSCEPPPFNMARIVADEIERLAKTNRGLLDFAAEVARHHRVFVVSHERMVKAPHLFLEDVERFLGVQYDSHGPVRRASFEPSTTNCSSTPLPSSITAVHHFRFVSDPRLTTTTDPTPHP